MDLKGTIRKFLGKAEKEFDVVKGEKSKKREKGVYFRRRRAKTEETKTRTTPKTSRRRSFYAYSISNIVRWLHDR